jgi:type IV pilus assembly protein PilW
VRTCDRGHRLHGFSLIEIMVGIVIGMIAILVIYQVFAAAEGIKRNTTSVGDAQQNGLLSSFMLNIELANASNGIAITDVMTALATCPATADPATTFRPIPVLITDGGGSANPDSFVVNYSLAQRVVTPVPFFGAAAAGAAYQVQSPNGFTAGDLILAISLTGACAVSRATGVSAPNVNGVVTINHTGAPVGFNSDSNLLNLGPQKSGQRMRYDVSGETLRSVALWDATGAPAAPEPNPIASNIVNMKLLYGIDDVGDGLLHAWVPATGAWSDATLLAAPNATLAKIKAVRLGIVVRGEQWDKDAPDVPWSLFDGTYSGTFTRANGNFRYRTYETIIPLRNSLWNPVS